MSVYIFRQMSHNHSMTDAKYSITDVRKEHNFDGTCHTGRDAKGCVVVSGRVTLRDENAPFSTHHAQQPSVVKV